MVIKIIIGICIIAPLLFVSQIGRREYSAKAEVLSVHDLEIVQRFEGETISLGYIGGSRLEYLDFLFETMVNELGINIEFLHYDYYEEMEKSAISSDIDGFISLFTGEERENLNYITSNFLERSVVVTDMNQPLSEISGLRHSRIGILEEHSGYLSYQDMINDPAYTVYFFNNMEALLDALETEEINAVIMNMNETERLINRENLKIEHVFRNELREVQFVTANDEIYTLFNILDNYREEFHEAYVSRNFQALKDEVKIYILEKYQSIIEEYDIIEVGIGMHNTNFPYSYFRPDGSPAGMYIEILNFFSYITGIEYIIVNDLNNTDLNKLLTDLNDNDVQFLLGLPAMDNFEEIQRIGVFETPDNIIAITRYGNELRNFNSLRAERIGLVTAQEEMVTRYLGNQHYVAFTDYSQAVDALLSGDIGVLLGAESVLDYYYYVHGLLSITHSDLINIRSAHSILGNGMNAGLNELMAEIQRLYNIIYSESPYSLMMNRVLDYQRQRTLDNEQRAFANIIKTLISMVGISGIGFLVLLRRSRHLKRKTEKDTLTNLNNRYASEKKCKRLIEKNPDTFGAFLFIDLNNFKEINDTFGHAMGDKVLIQFSGLLKKLESDKNTICFRIAGDEFGIFRTGMTDQNDVFQMLRDLKNTLICELASEDGRTLQVRYSAGCAVYNLDTTDFNKLIEYADFAMYQAKSKKETTEDSVLEIFDLNEFQKDVDKKIKKNAIDTIIAEKQLFGVYQPVCSLDDGDIYGYEGLSRSTNTTFSNIFELITAADEVGRLHDLDLEMMEAVIKGFKGEGKLFVNMEGKTTEEVLEYIALIIQIAESSNLDTSRIVLELTERRAWNQETLKVIQSFIEEYKFLIAIDDFGMSHSNISLILELSPDIVKIDRYLIHEIHNDAKRYSYMKSFLEFAKENDIQIVCEGIEVKEEFEILKQLGSDFGQGYYLGKPE